MVHLCWSSVLLTVTGCSKGKVSSLMGIGFPYCSLTINIYLNCTGPAKWPHSHILRVIKCPFNVLAQWVPSISWSPHSPSKYPSAVAPTASLPSCPSLTLPEAVVLNPKVSQEQRPKWVRAQLQLLQVSPLPQSEKGLFLLVLPVGSVFVLSALPSQRERMSGYLEDFLIKGARFVFQSCTAASQRIQRPFLCPLGFPPAVSSDLLPNSYCVQLGSKWDTNRF